MFCLSNHHLTTTTRPCCVETFPYNVPSLLSLYISTNGFDYVLSPLAELSGRNPGSTSLWL
ncbi:unnamed protein product [Brassica oleracea]